MHKETKNINGKVICFCPSCHKEIKMDAKQCPYCGLTTSQKLHEEWVKKHGYS